MFKNVLIFGLAGYILLREVQEYHRLKRMTDPDSWYGL